MSRPIDSCKLCQRRKPLAKSHIIPEFLLKEAEDWIERGKSRQKQPHLSRVDFETAKEIYCHQKGNVVKMEGLTEYLLCDDCEKNIAVGESYARTHLLTSASANTPKTKVRTVLRYRVRAGKVLRAGYELRSVDYSLLKRFQIGIIWRACVATGKAFQKAKATAPALERMRLALLSGKFDERLVPCVMEKVYDPVGGGPGIHAPFVGGNVVYLVFGGYRWRFFMDGKAPRGAYLRKDGRLFAKVTDIDEIFTPDYMLQQE
jgi:hypothetical protein